MSGAGGRAAIARGSVVEVYELPGGQLVRTIAHGAPVSAVAFATTGRDLISGATDGSLLVTRDSGARLMLPATPGGIDAVGSCPTAGSSRPTYSGRAPASHGPAQISSKTRGRRARAAVGSYTIEVQFKGGDLDDADDEHDQRPELCIAHPRERAGAMRPSDCWGMTPTASLGGPGRRLPRVYRGAVHLDEARTLFTLQALTKASDAHDVRVESTKLKDYDIES